MMMKFVRGLVATAIAFAAVAAWPAHAGDKIRLAVTDIDGLEVV
jgi:hypothetical protein